MLQYFPRAETEPRAAPDSGEGCLPVKQLLSIPPEFGVLIVYVFCQVAVLSFCYVLQVT